MALYDPAKVIVTFLGVPIVGYADGTFVSFEENEDAFTLSVGAGGDTARVRSNNYSGIFTLTLMQTSPSNDHLSAAHAADRLSGIGAGPMLVKDMLGRTLLAAQNAWVKKRPTVEFGKELNNREWTLEADFVQGVVGGSSVTGTPVG